MKKTLSFMLTMMVTLSAFAQEASAQKGFWDDPFTHPLLPVYVVTTFVFVVILLVALVAIYVIKILNMFTQAAEKEKAAKLGIAYVPEPQWIDKVVQQLNASVPLAQEKDIELDHNYDGIKELDNHLPPWWKWLFAGTIGWAAIYIVVYHILGAMPLQINEYNNEVVLAEEQVKQYRASQPQEAIDENNITFKQDNAIIEKGKAIFTTYNCGSCHANDGGGNTIGPNITDAYWIHGGGIKNVFTTIKTGVLEKGMPAWGKAMSTQDVRDVAFFVMSLQGTKPANPKAPQGEEYKEPSTPTDSTKVASL